MGRAAEVEVARKEGISIVGPSAIPMEEGAPIPRPMTIEEIKQFLKEVEAELRKRQIPHVHRARRARCPRIIH